MNENQIYVIYGDHIKEMTASLLEAVDLKGRIPSHDSLIGLKPNLVVAKPSSTGATTTPEIVEGVIEYLQKNGFHNLLILEGSWVGDDTGRAFKVCGYDRISRQYGVPLFDTKKDSVSVQSYGGISMEICKKALETDFLIDIPGAEGALPDLCDRRSEKYEGLHLRPGETPLPYPGPAQTHRLSE